MGNGLFDGRTRVNARNFPASDAATRYVGIAAVHSLSYRPQHLVGVLMAITLTVVVVVVAVVVVVVVVLFVSDS